jgi:hypothetical protein
MLPSFFEAPTEKDAMKFAVESAKLGPANRNADDHPKGRNAKALTDVHGSAKSTSLFSVEKGKRKRWGSWSWHMNLHSSPDR